MKSNGKKIYTWVKYHECSWLLLDFYKYEKNKYAIKKQERSTRKFRLGQNTYCLPEYNTEWENFE